MKNITINIIIIFAAVAALQIIYAYGQQDKKLLTLEECLEIGAKNNKALQISNSKINAANAKLSEIVAAQLPALRFSAAYLHNSYVDPFKMTTGVDSSTGMPKSTTFYPTILDNYTMKLSLSQPLFTGFRLSGNSDMTEDFMLAAKEDYQRDFSQMKLDVKNTFWNYYKALELKKIIDENISQTKSHLTDIENFKKSGLATDNDV